MVEKYYVLLASVFTYREQRVKAENCLSSWASASSGVPQDSILGPLYFLVFINDLHSASVSSFHLFADDVKALKNTYKTTFELGHEKLKDV